MICFISITHAQGNSITTNIPFKKHSPLKKDNPDTKIKKDM